MPIAAGTEFADVQAELVDQFGPGQPRLVRTVGPLIGSELIRSSAILIVIGELFILGYLWIRFGFRYGTAAIVALLHDVLLVVGTFAILGYFFFLEFDALFVTALLTIIGFSVHDTIVVFDRIRENRVRHAGEPFGAIVNHSILQTAGRSIITSLTVVITLGALLLLGPTDDPHVHPGTAARRRQRHVLLDLQRQPDPRGLGRLGSRAGRHARRCRPEPDRAR